MEVLREIGIIRPDTSIRCGNGVYRPLTKLHRVLGFTMPILGLNTVLTRQQEQPVRNVDWEMSQALEGEPGRESETEELLEKPGESFNYFPDHSMLDAIPEEQHFTEPVTVNNNSRYFLSRRTPF
ncbi:hypothetical protein MMC10_002806 [Thelotrema lepadinum]|nr:hypothetical protein [Thelotrema lepadinum]